MSLTPLPDTGTTNFNTQVRAVLDLWKASIEAKAESSHSHGAGGVVMSICTNEATLGNGSTDGEKKECSESGNRYKWDATNSKWRVLPGNIYASAPSASTYTIETGTIVNIGGETKQYSGSTFDSTSYPPDRAIGFIMSQETWVDGLDSAYSWVFRGGTADYSFHDSGGGDSGIGKPVRILTEHGAYYIHGHLQNTVDVAAGSMGSGNEGIWRFQDQNSLGYDAIYANMVDNTDPSAATTISILRADPITISAGVCGDATGVKRIEMPAAMTKYLRPAFSAGDGGGMLDTGTIAADEWYTVWAILNSTTGAVDILASTSMTSPTMPSGYDYKGFIGCLWTDFDAYPHSFRMEESGLTTFTGARWVREIGPAKDPSQWHHTDSKWDLSSYLPAGHYEAIRLQGKSCGGGVAYLSISLDGLAMYDNFAWSQTTIGEGERYEAGQEGYHGMGGMIPTTDGVFWVKNQSTNYDLQPSLKAIKLIRG